MRHTPDGAWWRGAVAWSGELRLAREVGADEAVEAGPAAAEEIRELTAGRGCELVVDMVGSADSIALAAALAGFESHVTVVGLAGGRFEFGFGALPFEAQLTIPYWGSAVELGEVLDLARAGRIRAHVERFELERAGEAYERMREGSLEGRAVICPHG